MKNAEDDLLVAKDFAVSLLVREYHEEKVRIEKEITLLKSGLDLKRIVFQDLCSHTNFKSEYFRDYHKGEDNFFNQCTLCNKTSYSITKGVF